MVLRCDDCIRYHLGTCYELGVTKEELFDHFWCNVNYNSTDFDDPPSDWVPENQKLRLWNE